MRHKPALIRRPEVQQRTGMSRSKLYAEIAAGRFPKPVKLGPQLNVWPEAEVEAWIEQQIAARNRRVA